MFQDLQDIMTIKESEKMYVRYEIQFYFKNKVLGLYRGQTTKGLLERTEQHFDRKDDPIYQVIKEYGKESLEKIIVKPLFEYNKQTKHNLKLMLSSEKKDILDLIKRQKQAKKKNIVIFNNQVITPLERLKIQIGTI